MRARLPKIEWSDGAVLEKARAMVRAGYSDAFISNDIGMVQSQVALCRRDAWQGSEAVPGPNGQRTCAAKALTEKETLADLKLSAAERRRIGEGTKALHRAVEAYLDKLHPQRCAPGKACNRPKRTSRPGAGPAAACGQA